MQAFTYLTINLIVFFAPFLGNLFLRNKNTFKIIKNYLKSLPFSAPIFILWDIFATAEGHWSFNKEYTLGINIINLPFEEVLFFLTIPFACIALYELISIMIKERELKYNRNLNILLSILSIFLAFVFARPYTTLAFLFLAAFFLYNRSVNNIFIKRNYFLFMLVSFIPFFIVNGILTALPIVIYSPESILNFRIWTIPIKDFFFSIIMLSVYLSVYLIFKHHDKQS